MVFVLSVFLQHEIIMWSCRVGTSRLWQWSGQLLPDAWEIRSLLWAQRERGKDPELCVAAVLCLVPWVICQACLFASAEPAVSSASLILLFDVKSGYLQKKKKRWLSSLCLFAQQLASYSLHCPECELYYLCIYLNLVVWLHLTHFLFGRSLVLFKIS